MLFMPVTLIALNRVPDRDAGLAASLPNVGQQVGGSIGAGSARHRGLDRGGNTARHSAEAAKAGRRHRCQGRPPVHVSAAQAKSAALAIYDHALSIGFSGGSRCQPGSC